MLAGAQNNRPIHLFGETNHTFRVFRVWRKWLFLNALLSMPRNDLISNLRCILAPELVFPPGADLAVFAAVVVLLAGGATRFGVHAWTARSITAEELVTDCQATSIRDDHGTLEHVH
jgi:hypothetical protein